MFNNQNNSNGKSTKNNWKTQIKNYDNFNHSNQSNDTLNKTNNSSIIQLKMPPCLGNTPHPMLIPIRYWNKKEYPNNMNIISKQTEKSIDSIGHRADKYSKTDTNSNFTRETDAMQLVQDSKNEDRFTPVININIYNNNSSNLSNSINQSRCSGKKGAPLIEKEESFIQNISIGNIGNSGISITNDRKDIIEKIAKNPCSTEVTRVSFVEIKSYREKKKENNKESNKSSNENPNLHNKKETLSVNIRLDNKKTKCISAKKLSSLKRKGTEKMSNGDNDFRYSSGKGVLWRNLIKVIKLFFAAIVILIVVVILGILWLKAFEKK